MEQLINMLKLIISNEKTRTVIDPVWVADVAIKKMDPEGRSPLLITLAATLELRQLARMLLRKYFAPVEDTEEAAEPHSLFPDLQWRYPKAPPEKKAKTSKAKEEGEEDKQGYVLLEEMDYEDMRFNIARLRKTGYGMLAHADRLEAWMFEHMIKKARAEAEAKS